MKKYSTCILLVALCAPFTANAARPSFTSLQQQINQLQAQVNSIESTVQGIRSMVVVDANGNQIGDYTEVFGQNEAIVFLERNNTLYDIYIFSGQYFEDPIFYDMSNCAGTGYVIKYENEMGIIPVRGFRNGFAYGPSNDQSGQPSTVSGISQWSYNSCYTPTNPRLITPNNYAPIEQLFDISIYTPPFRYELR